MGATEEKKVRRPLMTLLAVIIAGIFFATACSTEGDEETEGTDGETDEDSGEEDGDEEAAGDTTIKVAVVGNPQMEDIAALTPDNFTADSGITVEFSILDEGTLRQVTTREAGSGSDEFDAIMIGMYEAPQFGEQEFIMSLDDFIADDDDYDVDDLIPAVRNGLSFDGSQYASPFYAESSFVMYRQDLLDEAGLEMPAEPTWEEVASIAREIDSDEVSGICLRGLPGWGDLGASFTTVLNTFGGTWWLANEDGGIGEAQVDQPEFQEALQFYVDLVQDAGQDDAAASSFNQCLSLYQEGKVAMWYDATVAAGLLEADDSDVQGQNGYALAPTNVTDASGWLWAWSLAIPTNSPNPEAAWEFISWATSAEYIETAGEQLDGGWAAVPPGTRVSTYENENYQEAAEAFADITLQAMEAAPIDNPGTEPRPGLPGVQYVGVPEFQDVGNRCTEEFSSVIGGSTSVEDAIANCQTIASEVSES